MRTRRNHTLLAPPGFMDPENTGEGAIVFRPPLPGKRGDAPLSQGDVPAWTPGDFKAYRSMSSSSCRGSTGFFRKAATS